MLLIKTVKGFGMGKSWQKMNAKRFDNIMLKTKTVGAKATPEGIEVTFAAGTQVSQVSKL